MITFMWNHPFMLANAERKMQCPVCGLFLSTSAEHGQSVSILDVLENGNIVLGHMQCVQKVLSEQAETPTTEGA